MTAHTPLRAAAIREAARSAGAIDPAEAVAFIPATETLHPTDAVAALKSLKPYMFNPPPPPPMAKEMTDEEYAAAKRRVIRQPELDRLHAADARELTKITEKHKP